MIPLHDNYAVALCNAAHNVSPPPPLSPAPSLPPSLRVLPPSPFLSLPLAPDPQRPPAAASTSLSVKVGDEGEASTRDKIALKKEYVQQQVMCVIFQVTSSSMSADIADVRRSFTEAAARARCTCTLICSLARVNSCTRIVQARNVTRSPRGASSPVMTAGASSDNCIG
jgi:hypothetical protein